MKFKLLAVLAAVALMQLQLPAAQAAVFDFTLVGTYRSSGIDSPISGTLTFDDGLFETAASVNLGAFGIYDLLGGYGADLGSSFRVGVLNAAGDSELWLYLNSYDTLVTGRPTTIDSSLTYINDMGPTPDSMVTTRGASLSGTLTVASVPELSTWSMMILGFAGVGLIVSPKEQNGVRLTNHASGLEKAASVGSLFQFPPRRAALAGPLDALATFGLAATVFPTPISFVDPKAYVRRTSTSPDLRWG